MRLEEEIDHYLAGLRDGAHNDSALTPREQNGDDDINTIVMSEKPEHRAKTTFIVPTFFGSTPPLLPYAVNKANLSLTAISRLVRANQAGSFQELCWTANAYLERTLGPLSLRSHTQPYILQEVISSLLLSPTAFCYLKDAPIRPDIDCHYFRLRLHQASIIHLHKTRGAFQAGRDQDSSEAVREVDEVQGPSGILAKSGAGTDRSPANPESEVTGCYDPSQPHDVTDDYIQTLRGTAHEHDGQQNPTPESKDGDWDFCEVTYPAGKEAYSAADISRNQMSRLKRVMNRLWG